MKNRSNASKIFALTLLVLAFCMMMLGLFTSCTVQTTPETESGEIYTSHQDIQIPLQVTKQEFEGHTYILFTGTYRFGIVHDPDCPCHQNTESYTR